MTSAADDKLRYRSEPLCKNADSADLADACRRDPFQRVRVLPEKAGASSLPYRLPVP